MKAIRFKNSSALLLTAAVILLPGAASAVGYRLPNQDPEAIARGNAFAATADNPSAIYYNPAGISQLDGLQLRGGLYLVSGGYTYTSGSSEYGSSRDFQPVPQIYGVYSPENLPLSFGLGVYCPYGLGIDWGNKTSFRTLAEQGQLMYATINPVVSWKIVKNLSVAIGPTFNYSQANFERGIGFLPNDHFKLNGNGWGYGFNAGVLWQPHEKWSFGVNYRYSTEVTYNGGSSTTPSPPLPASVSSSASITFPQYIVGGISFRPTPDWNIEFDLDWTDWSTVNSIDISPTAFGKQTLPLNFTSSFMYEIGATRQLGKGWFASLGFFFSENSSPDQYYNPLIPDSNLYLGSVGFGHHGKHFDWALAYQFGYNGGRTVTGAPTSPAGQTADGTYKAFNQGINAAITLKF